MNPAVFGSDGGKTFFSMHLGVDLLRIDAHRFIWKQMGPPPRILPQAHQFAKINQQCGPSIKLREWLY